LRRVLPVMAGSLLLALSNFLMARWNHIGIQFSFASPRVYGDGYDAKVRDASIYATYTFNF
jgi:hypothetical protein